MTKTHVSWALALLVIVGAFVLSMPRDTHGNVATDPGVTVTASSTTYTITTSSVGLLATSTARRAHTFQPINCTSGGTLYLNEKDVAAVARTGTAAFASSTALFAQGGQMPETNNAIRGILDVGTCTVLVTEWRLNI